MNDKKSFGEVIKTISKLNKDERNLLAIGIKSGQHSNNDMLSALLISGILLKNNKNYKIKLIDFTKFIKDLDDEFIIGFCSYRKKNEYSTTNDIAYINAYNDFSKRLKNKLNYFKEQYE